MIERKSGLTKARFFEKSNQPVFLIRFFRLKKVFVLF